MRREKDLHPDNKLLDGRDKGRGVGWRDDIEDGLDRDGGKE